MTDRSVETLRLLATGFVQAHEDGLMRPQSSRPFPDALQRGVNRLAADLLALGVAPPLDLPELIALGHQPLRDWALPLPPDVRVGQLMVANRPTDLCYEWSIDGAPAEWEQAAQVMPTIRSICLALGKSPEWYSHLRRALIETPVLGATTEARWHSDPIMSAFIEQWSDSRVYEPIPSYLLVDGAVWTCPHCGWTLSRDSRGHWHCADDLCERIVGDLSQKAKPHPLRTVTRRLRLPLRRYLVVPGVPELQLGSALAQMRLAAAPDAPPLQVTYWPDFDRVDFRVGFPDGAVWEVDVKDWSSPFRLAAELRANSHTLSPDVERFTYVVPNYREQLFPGYCRGAQEALGHRQPAIITVRQFLRRVRQRWEEAMQHA